MPTSAGTEKEFNVYGRLDFTIKGEAISMLIYQNRRLMTNPLYRNNLFLPFKDATSGEETYGGGRYIDVKKPAKESTTILIDFNQAYQPYCAYTTGYFCPVPPTDNHLEVAINAGVKHVDLWIEQ